MDECPRNILVINNDKLEVTDPLKCNLCKLCMGICDINAIEVMEVPNSYIFTMESDGSYPAKELLIQGADTIIGKAGQLKEILSEVE